MDHIIKKEVNVRSNSSQERYIHVNYDFRYSSCDNNTLPCSKRSWPNDNTWIDPTIRSIMVVVAKKKVAHRAVYKTSSKAPDLTSSTSDDEAIVMRLNVYSKDGSGDQTHVNHVNGCVEPPTAYNEFEPMSLIETHSFINHDVAILEQSCIQDQSNFATSLLKDSRSPCSHNNTSFDLNITENDTKEMHVASKPLAFPRDPKVVQTNSKDGQSMRLVQLLSDFEHKSRNSEWPSVTSISCYWCCHPFTCTPVGLPIRCSGEMFHVMGCFCSLECATAYNFGMPRVSVDRALERFMLINALASKLGVGGGAIKPAPDRLALSMFGGPLDIDEFRSYHTSRKHVIINQPPMLTLVQQVEEVDERDMKSAYSYIPLDVARVEKFQEKVRLRRTRPLVDPKNTLDHCMKLRYGNEVQIS